MGLINQLLGRPQPGGLPIRLADLDDDRFIDVSYQAILRRMPDDSGKNHYLQRFRRDRISRDHFLNALIDSQEFAQSFLHSELGTSLHESRIRFVRSLPAAKTIVDLGGSAQDCDNGALVEMGYPYHFNKLSIIDLPIDQRHKLYQNNSEVRRVETHLGPVEYVYQSMTDLSPFADNSVDLVYSGQSIEHVTEAEGHQVIAEVLRILRPGGYFCLDTPNGRITRIQQDKFVDPDHKIEYTHQQLHAALASGGFEVCESKGLNYAGPIQKRSEFSPRLIAKHCGVFSAIEDCYLLAYVCRKPAAC